MIVNCVAYDRGQKLSDISLADVRCHLAKKDLVYRFKKAGWM